MTNLSWSEVDFDLMEVRVTGKGKKPHRIPISPMMEIILHAQVGNHPVQVFTFVSQRDVQRNPS